MAKLVGPLHSVDARGKFGKAIVFIGWKGIKDARMWLKPANPKTSSQGDVRQIFAGLGRAAALVEKDSNFHQRLIDNDLIPAGQSKQSYMVKKMREAFCATVSDYESLITEYEGASSKSNFDTLASDLGVGEIDIAYKSTTKKWTGGAICYVLAKLGRLLFPDVSPYSTDPASWTDTEINAFKTDIGQA